MQKLLAICFWQSSIYPYLVSVKYEFCRFLGYIFLGLGNVRATHSVGQDMKETISVNLLIALWNFFWYYNCSIYLGVIY